MNSVVGFSLLCKLPPQKIEAALTAQRRALLSFEHLQHLSVTIGESRLELWGHNNLNECTYYLPDGSLLALIGSPLGSTSLTNVWSMISNTQNSAGFELPWDGRLVLIKISADGKHWSMWNDWLGSIPVFHIQLEEGRLATTLEPVAVSAGGFSPDDIFLPGLVSLMINGHFFSDWTLYKNMQVVPPDCIAEWDENGFGSKQLWTVTPSTARWETGWDDLVDEMHDVSRQAIADVLTTQPTWILPLSSGLDSRLIAGVAADMGADLRTYAWGAPDSTDVVYSRQIAKTLDYPWKHIQLRKDFLIKYTPQWADLFGSSMHFHGMYQMCFLDALQSEPGGAILSGFLGDVLSGSNLMQYNAGSVIYQKKWYEHWNTEEAKGLFKFPIDDVLLHIADEVKNQISIMEGSQFSKALFFELWSRQRFFTNFQSTLSDYWRGIATPFLNRKYARFCLSLPRAALEHRRLLGDVIRRYYGRLAVIPGTYANEPFVLTGKYLLMRRVAQILPPALHLGPLKGFGNVQLRLDVEAVQATGRASLWPLFEATEQLARWLDVSQIEREYRTIMKSKEDIRPLRRLQSVQIFAYRLLSSKDSKAKV